MRRDKCPGLKCLSFHGHMWLFVRSFVHVCVCVNKKNNFFWWIVHVSTCWLHNAQQRTPFRFLFLYSKLEVGCRMQQHRLSTLHLMQSWQWPAKPHCLVDFFDFFFSKFLKEKKGQLTHFDAIWHHEAPRGKGVGGSTIVETGIPICVLSFFFCRFDILKA